MIATLFVRTTLLAGSVALAASVTAGPAVAQAWNWGGGSEVASSGRETVKMNASFRKGELLVSFTDRRLYLVTATGEALSYPIAIPREQSRWQGVLSVSNKRVNPSWTPTPAMIKENPRLPTWVPGGHPLNPLGVRALYLGDSMYRIHGTDAPWTIGQPVSKGCIRMYNQDVVDLFERVAVGTKVTVTWQSFGGAKVAAASDDEADKPAKAQRTASKPKADKASDADSDDDKPVKPQRIASKAKAEDSKAKPARAGQANKAKEDDSVVTLADLFN